jgi:aromatic-L-amino-acid decarboxylase
MQTVCVRHEPAGLAGLADERRAAALNEHTLTWAGRINESGQALITPALIDDLWTVRISIGAEPTERAHLQRLWDLMRQVVAGSVPDRRPWPKTEIRT